MDDLDDFGVCGCLIIKKEQIENRDICFNPPRFIKRQALLHLILHFVLLLYFSKLQFQVGRPVKKYALIKLHVFGQSVFQTSLPQ